MKKKKRTKKTRKKATKKAAPRRKPVLLTRRELADRVGVHMQTVVKWERHGLPVARRGGRGRPTLYDLAAVRAWRQIRKEDQSEDAVPPNYALERAKKTRWEAALREQEFRIRAGELLPLKEAAAAQTAMITAARNKMLSWKQTLSERVHRAATLEGLPGVENEIDDAVREVLTELGEHQPKLSCPDCGHAFIGEKAK